jgi:hypothetical protein
MDVTISIGEEEIRSLMGLLVKTRKQKLIDLGFDVDNFLERCERPKDPSNNEEDER